MNIREKFSPGVAVEDHVVLTDAKGLATGTAGKLAAHQKGLRHKAFSIFIFDNSGRFMLQQRAMGKYHSGGLWSNTCCSHPRPGEDMTAAAHRRLVEEMGFDCELRFLFETHYCAEVSNGLTENEDVSVFAGICGTAPNPDPAEVMDWRWLTRSDIEAELSRNGDSFSIWFGKYWQSAHDHHARHACTT